MQDQSLSPSLGFLILCLGSFLVQYHSGSKFRLSLFQHRHFLPVVSNSANLVAWFGSDVYLYHQGSPLIPPLSAAHHILYQGTSHPSTHPPTIF